MKNNLYQLTITCLALFTLSSVTKAQGDNSATEAKIDQLIKKMTLEEKISMLHANSIFTTSGVERLGIPGLSTDDGPLGVREDLKFGRWMGVGTSHYRLGNFFS